jgi:hypothetical protein
VSLDNAFTLIEGHPGPRYSLKVIHPPPLPSIFPPISFWCCNSLYSWEFSSMQPRERRRTERLKLAIPLSVSVLNSDAPGHGTESVNVSAGGMYFATNLPVSRGTGVRLLFKMPEEITRTRAGEWACMGHVVHVTPLSGSNGRLGVGVQFDCYEVVPTAESLGGFNTFVNDDVVR